MTFKKNETIESLLLENSIEFSEGPKPGTVQFYPNRDMQARLKLPFRNVVTGVDVKDLAPKADVTITRQGSGERKFYARMDPGKFGIDYAASDVTSLRYKPKNGAQRLFGDNSSPVSSFTIHRIFHGPADYRKPAWVLNVDYLHGKPGVKIECANPERIFSPSGRVSAHSLQHTFAGLTPERCERMTELATQMTKDYRLRHDTAFTSIQAGAAALLGHTFSDADEWGEPHCLSAASEMGVIIEGSLNDLGIHDRDVVLIMNKVSALPLYEQSAFLMATTAVRGGCITSDMQEAMERAIAAPDLLLASTPGEDPPSP
ncbi:hypothetical protein [Acetobacter persici]|uniref:Uncharacterized protein n=1 Tax=Acetobacter persici TaxID=1076596 RepID=A0A1U9LJN9_9PROT|nr:hypothetical protein [Acetobacter persici]AQT06673.1 hypothetical protein A0U91_16850 [Acetobacter persici]